MILANDKRNSVLIFLTQGTYGHNDDAIGAILVANGLRGVKHETTLLLLDDGVYFVVKNQDPSHIELANNLNDINDFLELGGRIVALESSLKKRNLSHNELIDGVEVIQTSQVISEIDKHDISMTF
jgi:sulfur relay (sulfurtransferase) DsrF/TusC family protein